MSLLAAYAGYPASQNATMPPGQPVSYISGQLPGMPASYSLQLTQQNMTQSVTNAGLNMMRSRETFH